MYIVKLEAYGSGARPALQSWELDAAPAGYALCPDRFYDVFYSTIPAGFVDITVEHGVVTDMTVNEDAFAFYMAANPPQSEEDASIDYDAVLLDHDYRLLCLEQGL